MVEEDGARTAIAVPTVRQATVSVEVAGEGLVVGKVHGDSACASTSAHIAVRPASVTASHLKAAVALQSG